MNGSFADVRIILCGIQLEGTETTHVPAPAVHAVDTTGAGDAFLGALAFFVATTKVTPRSMSVCQRPRSHPDPCVCAKDQGHTQIRQRPRSHTDTCVRASERIHCFTPSSWSCHGVESFCGCIRMRLSLPLTFPTMPDAHGTQVPLKEVVRRCNEIAAISVQSDGTQSSFPRRDALPASLFA